MDPDGDHLAYLRAEVNLAFSDPSAAEGDLEEYLARFPESARALASLAGIRLLQLRPADAEELLDAARRITPDDEYIETVSEKAGFTKKIDLAGMEPRPLPALPATAEPPVTQLSFKDAGYRRH
jgi:hypothetical protein